MTVPSPQWLEWVQRLQAVAQTGLTYARDPYDAERYREVSRLAAEIASRHAATPFEAIRDLFAAQSGYATPKVDVRGVVFRDDTLLLVREKTDGLWALPGGWGDILATPSENVVREIREEAGLETRAVKLLAAWDRARQGHPPIPFHVYKLFFLCEETGGTAQPGPETDEVGFFRESELPPLSVGRFTATQATRLFRHRENPAWPADFD